MVYVRGHAEDYDEWARLGCTGWSYRELLPYFKKSEHFENNISENNNHASELRGKQGLWNIRRIEPSCVATTAMLESFVESGFKFNNDYNSGEMEGVSHTQANIKNGWRHSPSEAFIHAVAGERPNLTIRTNTLVTRIGTNSKAENDSFQASGVYWKPSNSPQNEEQFIKARKEVILCAGAIHSPAVLQHSGIGPRGLLEDLKIPVVKAIENVGKGLKDHLFVPMHYVLGKSESVNAPDAESITSYLRYFLFGKGFLSTQALELVAFERSDDKMKAPDLQYHVVSSPLKDKKTCSNGNLEYIPEDDVPDGLNMLPTLLQPQSTGTVNITSNDPFALPIVDPHYLENENDIVTLRKGMKRGREAGKIFAKKMNLSKELEQIDPTGTGELDPLTDEYIDDYIRKFVVNVYHESCTCRMGGFNDDSAVLDPNLRVKGFTNLRVADASSFPTIPRANTQAPVIMLAEKAAALISSQN